MKTKITILFLILFLPSIFFAGEVPSEQAKAIAQKIYFEKQSRTSEPAVESIVVTDELTIAGERGPLMYVFTVNTDDGFVIIAADDRVPPLLGYSLSGAYDEDVPPPAFDAMMESFKQQIQVVQEFNLPANELAQSDWEYYRSEKVDLKKNVPVVEPLITSLWDQDLYYNKLCPDDPAGVDGHARVGCVATAMAQIMRYHQYPPKGYGSHSYNYYYYGTISADFENATYLWDEMDDWLVDHNEEVAEICFHCGVAVEMMYGPEGSGAYSEDVPYALKTYFNYAPTTRLERKSYYTTADWQNLLKSELDEFRPMYVSGSGSGGHAFVCDGYDDSDLFHFNWGWGGLYNGYYYINALHPGTHDYSYYQAAIVGIQAPVPPSADFTANTTTVITGGAVNFTDLSSGVPYEWLWEIEGASPATSEEKNPMGIVYENPGTYSVSLTASNMLGSHTKTVTDFITVSGDAMPVADFQADDVVPAVGQEVMLEDLSLNSPSAWRWEFQPATVTFLNGTNEYSQHPVVKFNDPVVYSVKLTVTNAGGQDSISKQNFFAAGGYPVPFSEDFELGTFKEEWAIENPDGGVTWDGYYKVSGNLPSRRAAWINFHAYTAVGARDRLISPNINLAAVSDPMLFFKHAYAAYNSSRSDSLIVFISGDNGSTWERALALGEDGSGSFATRAPTVDEFIPRYRDDWCGSGFGSPPISIDLSPWQGNHDVRVMFESVNGHGNSLYVDDFAVIGKAGPAVVQSISDVTFLEDHTPQTAVEDLNSIFISADSAGALSFDARSDNDKISPTIYENRLLISFIRDFSGSGNIFVTATNADWLSVTDTFLVTILPMNDPPAVNLPDSLMMCRDSTSVYNIWNFVHDKESPDSLLNFDVSTSGAALSADYNSGTGDVSLFSSGYFDSEYLFVHVTDDSGASASDSMKIMMEDVAAVVMADRQIPQNFEFHGNYPNPFNSATRFRIALPKQGRVKLEIYNAIGQKVITVLDEIKQSGIHEVEFNAGNLPSGLYLARFQFGQHSDIKKFLLMK